MGINDRDYTGFEELPQDVILPRNGGVVWHGEGFPRILTQAPDSVGEQKTPDEQGQVTGR